MNRDFVLGEMEKAKFSEFMRLYERLYGLRIVSYCLMSNHFHLLVEVPQRPADEALPDDEGLIAHVEKCLGGKAATNLRWELEHYRAQSNNQAAEELRESWFARMWDISQYMKILKQRFTQWFNRVHQRRGTLWEDRFKSVLVEGKGPALKAMAAYIDLNPVRAGICEDPKDYRWCSYGEAVAGGKKATRARQALIWLDSFTIGMTGEARERSSIQGQEGPCSLDDSLRRWRCYLFGIPESEARQKEELAHEQSGGKAHLFRARIPRQKALEVLENGGRLEKADYLRCRVRYFIDGGALGSKAFIEEVFQEAKSHFHSKRKTGARSLRGMKTVPKPDRLYNLRQLGKDALG
ncbi:chemotaxis protein CheW [Roseibacillus ishigakijimensis]|uniref:Chemotaxis protein CheW n=1 Tax=Roseibacillus ishigakijimensis TaxID=454146 RepID=A0A934RLM2_9BACT|nr:chemotaxis protein CheW [Roseibacillus ishigakijimensis]